ncbi:MAG TPA: hypothetical protein PJ994_04510 [Tepidiformaceae bacterium]|nr:hypothetical protein [Tepidiformaceae bacterium]HMO96788.1 hypothetical protein [Tepidiformaceae bacterium]
MPGRPLISLFQPLLFQPVESETGFSFSDVLNEARAVWFPELAGEIEVRIAAKGPLAFVTWGGMGEGRHVVVFHPVLNRPDVPIEVVRFIAKHELTHIARPPARIGGSWESHHPAFWEHEESVGPERFAVWSWIHANLGKVLFRGTDGLAVYSTWRRRISSAHLGPYTPHLPFGEIPWQLLCPEGGAQLRLPPEWPARPLPITGPATFPFRRSPIYLSHAAPG